MYVNKARVFALFRKKKIPAGISFESFGTRASVSSAVSAASKHEAEPVTFNRLSVGGRTVLSYLRTFAI